MLHHVADNRNAAGLLMLMLFFLNFIFNLKNCSRSPFLILLAQFLGLYVYINICFVCVVWEGQTCQQITLHEQ